MAHSHLALAGGYQPWVSAVYPHLNQMLTVFSCGLDEIVPLVGTLARGSAARSLAAGRNLRDFSAEPAPGGMRDGDPAAGPVDQRWAEVGRSRGEGRNGPPATGRQACEALTSRSKCACTQGNRESADKPGSVVGNHPSGACVAARLERPTRKHLRAAGTGPQACAFPYLVLLQVGFAVPRPSPAVRWSLTRAISPLPKPFPLTGPVFGRFVFCGTFPRVTPGGRYPPPCPLESGLSSTLLRRDHPADSSNSSFYVRNHSDRRGTYFRLNR